MKRYDLYGGSKNAKQFGAKQFWVVNVNERYDLWVSYNTVVAVVDHENEIVICGRKARGYSCTTSKQVSQAYMKFAFGYYMAAYDSDYYHEFNVENDCCTIYNWDDHWDDLNFAPTATYYLGNVLNR